VHLYEFRIGGEPPAAAWARLSDEELRRAGRIADPARRARFVARRAALHDILAGYPAGVRFNSADSGDVAAVAVSPRPVGVDLELDTPRRSQERVAQRMFARDERSLLDSAGGAARRRLFYRCWVAKEAYAKAHGQGLAMRFDEFSVVPALGSPDGTGPVGEGWTVSIRTRAGRHVAVAAAGGDWKLVEVGRG
jgi:4'-phosphopantetheinyl transferase